MTKDRFRIWFFALSFIVGILTISVIELVRSHQSYIQVAYTEADLSGFLVSEWIEKSLSDIRAILKDSLFNVDENNIRSAANPSMDEALRNRSLAHKASQYDNIIFLGIFDQDCVIQYGSIYEIIRDSSRDLGRAYCDNVMQPPVEALKFSDLFLSSTGELNVSATYPLLNTEDRIIGFALAGLNLSFFQTWLDSIEQPAITISIIDANRILLARKPDSDDIGKPVKDARLAEFIQGDAEAGTFRRKSPVDGIERLWSLRKTGDFPFIVAVGYRLDDVLIPWRTKLISYGIGNLLLIVVTLSLAWAYQKNRMSARSMETLAMQDPLTGLMNRRSFNAIAKGRFAEARQNTRSDCVTMLDIDHFKAINDRLGHDVGDLALKEVADLVRANFRSSDLICRWGGEEFVVYLTDTTLADAASLAERLRQSVEAGLSHTDYAVTISQGLASASGHGSYEQMLKTADERLYRAKEAGRNRVCRN
jgi:diguanylate cyclase (GGDEF)-like protein